MLARLLRNLNQIHRQADDLPALLAVMERLVILLPSDWRERRDRGLVRAGLGRYDLACEDVQAYLAACPGEADAPALRRRLQAWQAAPRPPLH
jgi:regulator of sirC expression with transglutaminase-like and TPR domain